MSRKAIKYKEAVKEIQEDFKTVNGRTPTIWEIKRKLFELYSVEPTDDFIRKITKTN